MDSPPPCDLDPSVWNLTTAFYETHGGIYGPDRWRAMYHGAGPPRVLEACGCEVCRDRLELIGERASGAGPAPMTPRTARSVEIGPVRARVRELLAAGWTRTTIAVAAGVDQATVDRILRPDVQRVRTDTSVGVLAVAGPPPVELERRRDARHRLSARR